MLSLDTFLARTGAIRQACADALANARLRLDLPIPDAALTALGAAFPALGERLTAYRAPLPFCACARMRVGFRTDPVLDGTLVAYREHVARTDPVAAHVSMLLAIETIALARCGNPACRNRALAGLGAILAETEGRIAHPHAIDDHVAFLLDCVLSIATGLVRLDREAPRPASPGHLTLVPRRPAR